MRRQIIKVTMTLRSDTIISSGYSIPGGEDITLKLDNSGRPFLPGSTLKGLLREQMTNYLCWSGADTGRIEKLFGAAGLMTGDDACRLVFGNLEMENPRPLDEITCYRAFTAMEDGMAKEGSLRLARCLCTGVRFSGVILCGTEDAEIVMTALSLIRNIGLLRNRGFGQVELYGSEETALPEAVEVMPCNCIRYRLRLETPMIITNNRDNAGLDVINNFVETYRFIPGSAVRGMVMSYLARENVSWFEAHKSDLLREGVRFSPAFPVVDGGVTIPTPSGFYEDKRKTRFYSVLTAENGVEPGDKRAGTGAFCTVENHATLVTMSPETVSALRISRANREVFTCRAMASGIELEGYVCVDDPTMAPEIARAFTEYVWLGADRYAGNGLCRVTALEPAEAPAWRRFSYSDADKPENTLYMMLLSPSAMLQNSECVGLNESTLGEILGVEKVEITACASSVAGIQGFNRRWGSHIPSTLMYSAGSVFALRCTPAPQLERVRKLEETGIGMRRSEGFGQVLFLKDYAGIASHKAWNRGAVSTDSDEKKLRRARIQWLLNEKNLNLRGLSNSQVGSLQALCQKAAYSENPDTDELLEFLGHNASERGARHGARFEQAQKDIAAMLGKSMSQLLGVPCEDSLREKLLLLSDWIDLSRKEN